MIIVHTDSNGRAFVSSIAPGVTPEQAAAAMRLAPGTWRVVADEEVAAVQASSDTRTTQEKRESAYREEADPLRNKAFNYFMEAEGWSLEEDMEQMNAAVEKMNAALREYVAKKTEIRNRYPDPAT